MGSDPDVKRLSMAAGAGVNFGLNSPLRHLNEGQRAIREIYLVFACSNKLLRHRRIRRTFRIIIRVSCVRGSQRVEAPLVKFLEYDTISVICKQPQKSDGD